MASAWSAGPPKLTSALEADLPPGATLRAVLVTGEEVSGEARARPCDCSGRHVDMHASGGAAAAVAELFLSAPRGAVPLPCRAPPTHSAA